MKGLVLQGGGAKGAFQIGAIKALLEKSYVFDGVVGTSIGALNASMLVQDEFDKLYSIWDNLSFEQVLDIDSSKITKIKKLEFDNETFLYAKEVIKTFLRHGGLSTEKIKYLIYSNTNEDKIRASKMDFGLVTVRRKSELSFEALTLFKEDIPQGKVADYIMASANFPLFAKHTIDNARYYDGGLYDNLPINMLLEKGYTDIIAIRLGDTLAPIKKPQTIEGTKLLYIDPSDDIGNVLNFDPQVIKRSIKLGYFDAIRTIDNMDGKKYCIKKVDDNDFDKKMLCLAESFFDRCIEVLGGVSEGTKLDKYVTVSKKLGALLKIYDNRKKAWITFIELFSDFAGINRFQIVTIDDLIVKLVSIYKKELNLDKYLKRRIIKNNSKEYKCVQIIKALLEEIIRKGSL